MAAPVAAAHFRPPDPFAMSSSTLHPLEARLGAIWPPGAWADVTVLLAVSGGADSVALLRAMVALSAASGHGGAGRLCAAHLNHQLRGPDSDADEQFVLDLCRGLNVPCEAARIRLDPQAAGGEGLEAAARAARYDFLERAAARIGARYVVTAHTADDQAETILHRILRGTGLGGLAGMARARPLGHAALIRPLLGVRRAELHDYLADLGQPYRRDASNLDARFTRNRIRHNLIPQLVELYNPAVVEALLRLGTLAGEAQAVIDAMVDRLVERCVAVEGAQTVTVAADPLADQPPYLVRELLMAVWRRQRWPMRSMGLAQWDLLAEMLAAARTDSLPPKQTLPGAISAEVQPGVLRLVPAGR